MVPLVTFFETEAAQVVYLLLIFNRQCSFKLISKHLNNMIKRKPIFTKTSKITRFFFVTAVTALLFITCKSTQKPPDPDFSIETSCDRYFHDKIYYFPSGGRPTLVDCDTVIPQLPMELHVVFSMYSRSTSGNTSLTFSYKILKPDGGVLFDTTGIVAFSDVMNEKKGLITSRVSPQIVFSKNDTPGVYKIIVTAEDRINKTRAVREKTIVLSSIPKSAAPFDIVSFNVWVHGYCNNPEPSRAIEAFSYFIESESSNDDAIFWPVFYFFQCLFRDNPWLQNQLVASFSANSVRLREYTVFLLRSINYIKDNNSRVIPDSLWKRFDKAAENGFSEPFTLACMSASPQVIEAAFYYYGKYQMIKFLIECLGLSTPSGYETFRTHAHRYGKSCSKFVDRESADRMSDNAKKILGKAYSNHSLIKTFCDFAYEFDDISAESKKVLDEITSQTSMRKPTH